MFMMKNQTYIVIVVLVIILTMGVFVWPTLYSYEKMMSGYGSSYMIRINRITSTVEIYNKSRGAWEVHKDEQVTTYRAAPAPAPAPATRGYDPTKPSKDITAEFLKNNSTK